MNTTPSTTNGRRAAGAASEALADAVHEGTDRVAPVLAQVAEQAESLVRQGTDALREQAANLREQAANLRERAGRASDRTVGYIQDEPLKAVLIAAAAGAALMALANLAMRARDAR